MAASANPEAENTDPPDASGRMAPLGEIGSASVPLSPVPDDISFYEETEWAHMDEAVRSQLIAAMKSQFENVVEEIEGIGDGAGAESLSSDRKKKRFKISLIVFTGIIALTNFFGSTFNDYSKVLAIVSGVIALFVSTLGTIDSFFSFGERALSMMELHYRCSDAVANLKARWAVAVIGSPDFKSYRNAFRAVDAAQRELQQINRLAKRIMRDGDTKSGSNAG
ncbi:MAG: hypothetical protein ACTHLO_05405 [Pseudolabrys sp.]